MTAEMSQTILIRLNTLEQSQLQMGMSLSASVTELGNRSDSQFRLLNNNIRAYGGTIQGALVRQRASN